MFYFCCVFKWSNAVCSQRKVLLCPVIFSHSHHIWLCTHSLRVQCHRRLHILDAYNQSNKINFWFSTFNLFNFIKQDLGVFKISALKWCIFLGTPCIIEGGCDSTLMQVSRTNMRSQIKRRRGCRAEPRFKSVFLLIILLSEWYHCIVFLPRHRCTN